MKIPHPSRREQIALFRISIVGDLLARELTNGELQNELKERARKRYRPPNAACTRTYSWKTLQRWYYAAKKEPQAGLLPASRTRGFALKLEEEQRTLLLDTRVEHPSAAAELVLSEAVRHGVVKEQDLTVSTLRRLYRTAGLPRTSKRIADRSDVQQRRWQAEHPGELWHGDVCHLVMTDEQGRPRRVLVHGLLDDASRYPLVLTARTREQERDMLEVFCGALLRHPAPHTLYLDNGACYRGDVLGLVCQRLGIHLVHATPYSPEARGKMERFWRTMRQRCTDHLSPRATLHEINQALWAWIDADYTRRPHAALMGQTPRRRYLEALPRLGAPLVPKQLAAALEVTMTRLVKKDSTFELDAKTYEVNGRHLSGQRITIVVDALTDGVLRVLWQEKPVRFAPCDPVANRHRSRSPAASGEDAASTPSPSDKTPFDPIAALLKKAREVDDE